MPGSARGRAESGLDPAAADEVLSSGRYCDEVRAEQRFWQMQGISGVTAILINKRCLISGGQPPEVFEQALRRIAQEGASATA